MYVQYLSTQYLIPSYYLLLHNLSKMDTSKFDLLLQDELVFTTQSLVLPLCSTDDIGCVPQDMDVTDWLNRSDEDPNSDKEKHGGTSYQAYPSHSAHRVLFFINFILDQLI